MKFNWLPNSFTFSNLFLGFIAIIFISHAGFNNLSQYYVYASLCIIAAGIFDFLDGAIARKINSAGLIGKELDSLGDLVSFGIVPGFMFYMMFFSDSPVFNSPMADYPVLGTLIAFIFPLNSALRLAKFNVMGQSDFFIGIPAPVAGISVVLVLNFYSMPDIFNVFKLLNIDILFIFNWLSAFAIFIFYALLMNSRFIFIKKLPMFVNLSKKNTFHQNILNIFILIMFILFFKFLLLAYIFYYSLKPIFTFDRFSGNLSHHLNNS